ncbi:MAG: signal peptide peptidase SppA [Desulfovibrionaceae bacterium]
MIKKNTLSQRHPYFFGVALLFMAAALVTGAVAMFRSGVLGGGLGFGLSGPKFGLVRVDGVIEDSEWINQWIYTLRDDDDVVGVILRVNSPGGLVAPSQEIFEAVRDLASVKPVVASFGGVAASGGYYISAGATAIVANPASITGSIGVKAELLNGRELMNKIGVREEVIASGPYKNTGSFFTPLTPPQRQYMQDMVMDLHLQFVEDVAKARNMPLKQVQAIANGMALTGRQALDAGLVDHLGGFEDAVGVLEDICEVPERLPFIEGPRDDAPLFERFLSGVGLDLHMMQRIRRVFAAPAWVFRFQ